MKVHFSIFSSVLFLIVTCGSLVSFPGSVEAEWASKCTVNSINMNGPSGSAIIRATCNNPTTTNPFTGTARFVVDPSDTGADRMVAAVLTAIALNKNVSFDFGSEEVTDAGVVTGLSLNN